MLINYIAPHWRPSKHNRLGKKKNSFFTAYSLPRMAHEFYSRKSSTSLTLKNSPRDLAHSTRSCSSVLDQLYNFSDFFNICIYILQLNYKKNCQPISGCSHFIPLENTRKPRVFSKLSFQGV